MENRQHIQISKDVLRDKRLSNNDIGVYLAIGKYMNKDTKTAFPSQNTLVSDTGLALQTVRSCIKKLEDRNAFKIEKEGRKNIYVFSKEENFEMFDFEFLNKEDLSLSEKVLQKNLSIIYLKWDGITIKIEKYGLIQILI